MKKTEDKEGNCLCNADQNKFDDQNNEICPYCESILSTPRSRDRQTRDFNNMTDDERDLFESIDWS